MKKAWCVALLLFVLISETLCFGLRIVEQSGICVNSVPCLNQ